MSPSWRRCNDCGAIWNQSGRLRNKHLRCPRCLSWNNVRIDGKGNLIRWRVSQTAVLSGLAGRCGENEEGLRKTDA